MDESNEVKGDCYRKSAMLIALLGIALFILGVYHSWGYN